LPVQFAGPESAIQCAQGAFARMSSLSLPWITLSPTTCVGIGVGDFGGALLAARVEVVLVEEPPECGPELVPGHVDHALHHGDDAAAAAVATVTRLSLPMHTACDGPGNRSTQLRAFPWSTVNVPPFTMPPQACPSSRCRARARRRGTFERRFSE